MRSFTKQKTPVTIIVGIICGDGMVVASDSQTSATTALTAKRLDTEKIFDVPFDGDVGVIGIAGSATFAARAVELTQEACRGRKLTDYRQMAEAAEKSVREVDRLIVEPYAMSNPTPSDLERLRTDNNYSLLLANYFRQGVEQRPCLFTLDAPPGIVRKRENYAAVGCGGNVAEFLLGWFDFGTMNSRDAAITAAFIIGEVKKADYYCGGPTQLRVLYGGAPRTFVFSREMMELIEAEVEAGASGYKRTWAGATSKTVLEIAKKLDQMR